MSQKNNPGKTPAPANPTRAAEAEKATTDAKAKAAKPAKEPKVDAVLAKTITVITEKGANPKREGSASHARFALYKTGQSALAYIESCVAAGQLRRAARADLDWDVKHKFIELA